MEERINVAALLKDCPRGMELDCKMYDNVYLERVDKNGEYPIVIRIGKTSIDRFTKEGCWTKNPNAKCVIFPKGKNSWEGFQKPFKDGDIVATKNGVFIGIVKVKDNKQVNAYCAINGIISFINTLEVKEVDLEEEIEKCLKRHSMLAVGKRDFTDIAKHFFEIGLKSKKC